MAEKARRRSGIKGAELQEFAVCFSSLRFGARFVSVTASVERFIERAARDAPNDKQEMFHQPARYMTDNRCSSR
jgi:hypothetical protein